MTSLWGLCLKSGFRHKKAQEAQIIFLSFVPFVATLLSMIGVLSDSHLVGFQALVHVPTDFQRSMVHLRGKCYS